LALVDDVGPGVRGRIRRRLHDALDRSADLRHRLLVEDRPVPRCELLELARDRLALLPRGGVEAPEETADLAPHAADFLLAGRGRRLSRLTGLDAAAASLALRLAPLLARRRRGPRVGLPLPHHA